MKNKIKFREYNSDDFPYVSDIIEKTWEYDKYFPVKTSKLLGEMDLLECLNSQTFTQVAIKNGKVIGFIIGTCNPLKKDKKYQKKIASGIKEIKKELFGNFIYYLLYKKYDLINDKLLKKCHTNYEAELTFFALSEECRGLGIGKQLYEKFVEYLKSKNIDKFYLKTDTTCNYEFYEHMGFTRKAKSRVGLPFLKKYQMEFYIYEKKI